MPASPFEATARRSNGGRVRTRGSRLLEARTRSRTRSAQVVTYRSHSDFRRPRFRTYRRRANPVYVDKLFLKQEECFLLAMLPIVRAAAAKWRTGAQQW